MNKKDKEKQIQDYLDWYGDLNEVTRKLHWLFLDSRKMMLKKFILKNMNILDKDKQKKIKEYFKYAK